MDYVASTPVLGSGPSVYEGHQLGSDRPSMSAGHELNGLNGLNVGRRSGSADVAPDLSVMGLGLSVRLSGICWYRVQRLHMHSGKRLRLVTAIFQSLAFYPLSLTRSNLLSSLTAVAQEFASPTMRSLWQLTPARSHPIAWAISVEKVPPEYATPARTAQADMGMARRSTVGCPAFRRRTFPSLPNISASARRHPLP